MMNIGDTVPDFNCDTTHGPMNFHKYIEGSWAILFSHPSDFTPVCTTELGRVGSLAHEFARRSVKLVALSCDSVESHRAWVGDIGATQGYSFDYPIIADDSREIAVKWGMLQKGFMNKEGSPLTCRALYIIGPDKKLKLMLLYPASTGRNFPEILRCLDSLQLAAQYPVATPADWQVQNEVMVIPTVPDLECPHRFPKGVRTVPTPSGKKYLQMTGATFHYCTMRGAIQHVFREPSDGVRIADVGNGRQDTITIFPGDRPEALAQAFAGKHGLKKSMVKQLEELIAKKKTDASKFSSSRMSYSRASTSHQSSRMGMSQSADRLSMRSISAIKASSIESRPSNYGEWMYQREQKAKDQRRLEQLRTSSTRELQPSPRPKTTRPRSSSESKEALLIQRGEATQQKIKNLRTKAMEEEMQECTFRPTVNDRSDRLDRSNSSGRGQQRFDKLFSDAYEKELRQYDRLETAVKTEFPFRPATVSVRKAPESQSAMVTRLMNSKKNFVNVISKLKEELEAGQEPAESAFKPVTGRGPTTAKYERRGPVHEHLYEQRTHKQAVVQKLKQQEQSSHSQPKLAIPRSEELAAESRRRQLELLFARLDHDQDGLIAFSNLTLDDVDPRTVQLLAPIWTDLAQSEQPMDTDQFLLQMDSIMRSMSNEEKNFLLRAGNLTVRAEEPLGTGQFALSKNSEELANRRREQLGADIYARRMVEKTITAERVKELKQQLATQEMRECTFRPAVNNYKRR